MYLPSLLQHSLLSKILILILYDRHYAEHSGYFERKTTFLEDMKGKSKECLYHLTFNAPTNNEVNFLAYDRGHQQLSYDGISHCIIYATLQA